MLKNYVRLILGILLPFLLCINANAQNTPVAINGKLKVVGTQLVNQCGEPVQLRGVSTHGPQWFAKCYKKEALQTLVKDWGISVFRWAMYIEEDGYITNKEGFRKKIHEMSEWCKELGIYFLIDWHVLTPPDPNAHKDDAIEFWREMSNMHKNDTHVLYEICNEPNSGVSWDRVREYADDIIKLIRDNNDQTIIIVGTPTWSQDVDKASENMIKQSNIMYTLHFYAGTHSGRLREKAQKALDKGAPIFVTEFGTSDASGDNNYSPGEASTWISWLNQRKISWICWSYSDHGEVSSLLVPGSCNDYNNKWNQTSTSGTFIKGKLTENVIPFIACNGNNNQQQQPNQNQNNNNNNNQQQQPDQNQNNNNNNNQQQQPDQNQNNNNNNNQQQQPDQNQNNNNNNQQQQQPDPYPTLTQNVKIGDIYRIVNKKSGKVMSIDGSNLKQVRREDNDNKQLFQFTEAQDGFIILKNVASEKALTNLYIINNGVKITEEDVSEYDNRSQQWKFEKKNDWFNITNKSDWSNSKVLSIDNASMQDNADVILWDGINGKDEQLWGLEYVYSPTAADEIAFADCRMYPTIIREDFHLELSTDIAVIVDVYTPSGILCRHFVDECTYDISDMARGNYVVVVTDIHGKRILTQLIIKK